MLSNGVGREPIMEWMTRLLEPYRIAYNHENRYLFLKAKETGYLNVVVEHTVLLIRAFIAEFSLSLL